MYTEYIGLKSTDMSYLQKWRRLTNLVRSMAQPTSSDIEVGNISDNDIADHDFNSAARTSTIYEGEIDDTSRLDESTESSLQEDTSSDSEYCDEELIHEENYKYDDGLVCDLRAWVAKHSCTRDI